MITVGMSLAKMTECAHALPHLRKDELSPGDVVVIRTMRSKYSLRLVTEGLFEADGGWFEARGCSPLRIGVAGVTWGGSAIMPHLLAACGMRVEFGNRLITSPVKSITVFKAFLMN